MTNETSAPSSGRNAKTKRLSKGQRTHIRRQKQAARKASTAR